MPDASGNFQGITVPRIPWHEEDGAVVIPTRPTRIGEACATCPDPITCSGIGCAQLRSAGEE